MKEMIVGELRYARNKLQKYKPEFVSTQCMKEKMLGEFEKEEYILLQKKEITNDEVLMMRSTWERRVENLKDIDTKAKRMKTQFGLKLEIERRNSK